MTSTQENKNPDKKDFENLMFQNNTKIISESFIENSIINKIEIKKEVIFKIYKIKKINNWTEDENELLRNLVEKSCFKNWKQISEFFKGKTHIQCSSRYRRIKPGILKGYWNKEEDEKLLKYHKKYGRNWKMIAREMNNRSGKQIRDRFLNSLNPDLNKKKFTPKEDNLLIFLHNKYGSAWSKISKHYNGRSGDMIKNRFFSFLRKKTIPISTNMKFKKRILINEKLNETSKKSKNINEKNLSKKFFYKNNCNLMNLNEISEENPNINLKTDNKKYDQKNKIIRKLKNRNIFSTVNTVEHMDFVKKDNNINLLKNNIINEEIIVKPDQTKKSNPLNNSNLKSFNDYYSNNNSIDDFSYLNHKEKIDLDNIIKKIEKNNLILPNNEINNCINVLRKHNNLLDLKNNKNDKNKIIDEDYSEDDINNFNNLIVFNNQKLSSFTTNDFKKEDLEKIIDLYDKNAITLLEKEKIEFDLVKKINLKKNVSNNFNNINNFNCQKNYFEELKKSNYNNKIKINKKEKNLNSKLSIDADIESLKEKKIFKKFKRISKFRNLDKSIIYSNKRIIDKRKFYLKEKEKEKEKKNKKKRERERLNKELLSFFRNNKTKITKIKNFNFINEDSNSSNSNYLDKKIRIKQKLKNYIYRKKYELNGNLKLKKKKGINKNSIPNKNIFNSCHCKINFNILNNHNKNLELYQNPSFDILKNSLFITYIFLTDIHRINYYTTIDKINAIKETLENRSLYIKNSFDQYYNEILSDINIYNFINY